MLPSPAPAAPAVLLRFVLVLLLCLACARPGASTAPHVTFSSYADPSTGTPLSLFFPAMFPLPGTAGFVALSASALQGLNSTDAYNSFNFRWWSNYDGQPLQVTPFETVQSMARPLVSGLIPAFFPVTVTQYGTAYDTSNVAANYKVYLVAGSDQLDYSLSNTVYSTVGFPTGSWNMTLVTAYTASFSPRAWPTCTGVQAPVPYTDPRGLPPAPVISPSVLLVLGGEQGPQQNTLLNDVWATTDGGNTWLQLSAQAAFPARSRGAAANVGGTLCFNSYANECALLVGGRGTSGMLNDVWLSSDAGRNWRIMTTAAAFPARAGASLATAARGADYIGALVVMSGGYTQLANGVPYSGLQYTPQDVWLSYDGGWTWYPLLPLSASNANRMPYGGAVPYFDTLGDLTFYGGRVVNASGLSTSIATGILSFSSQLWSGGYVSPTTVAAALSAATPGFTLAGLPQCAYRGLSCFPAAPGGAATAAEAWQAGALQFNAVDNTTQVSCPFVASGCLCDYPSAALQSLPAYQQYTTSGLPGALSSTITVSCTQSVVNASDAFVFDSSVTDGPFTPYTLLCQGNGAYTQSLPPASYCTSQFLPELLQLEPNLLCVGSSCPAIQCQLPATVPANGGVSFVSYSGSSLTNTLQCPASTIPTGQLTQSCVQGLFVPPGLGQCVQLPTGQQCRVVSASNAQQVQCAVNEIVVGGGGDCSNSGQMWTVRQRIALSVSQPLPTMQGWEALCAESSVLPVTVFARCCLADNNTFLFQPLAYSAQTAVSFNAQAGSSFQQCERITGHNSGGAGVLQCPNQKTMLISGVACQPYYSISISVPRPLASGYSTELEYGCLPSVGFLDGVASGLAEASAICCDAFYVPQSSVCATYSQGMLLLQRLGDATFGATCPAAYNGNSQLMLSAGVPMGTFAVMPANLSSVIVKPFLNITADGEMSTPVTGLATACAELTYTCCAVLTQAASVSAVVDACPSYPSDTSNGVGFITSTTPSAPSSFGAAYLLHCPTPYTYLTGASQITCSPAGQWLGYTPNGTLTAALGQCEFIDTTQCLTVEERNTPLLTACPYSCGCYFDLSGDVDLQYQTTVYGSFSYSLQTCISSSSVPNLCKGNLGAYTPSVVCQNNKAGSASVGSVAIVPEDPSAVLTLAGAGPFTSGQLAMTLYMPQTGAVPKGCKTGATLYVYYYCNSTAWFGMLNVSDCNIFKFAYSSPTFCTTPTAAVAGAGMTEADGTLLLQCPSTAAVPYVLSQVGVSCGGLAQNQQPVVSVQSVWDGAQAFPLLASSQPIAVDTWQAFCYDSSWESSYVPRARYYQPTLMRGLCCPTVGSTLFSSCYLQPNLTCAADELAIAGGGNCSVLDVRLALVSAAYYGNPTGSVNPNKTSMYLAQSYNLGLASATYPTQAGEAVSVLDSQQLNQWAVTCQSASFPIYTTAGIESFQGLPAVDPITGLPIVAAICCQNPLLLQPPPQSQAPSTFPEQQLQAASQALSTAADFYTLLYSLGEEVTVYLRLSIHFEPSEEQDDAVTDVQLDFEGYTQFYGTSLQIYLFNATSVTHTGPYSAQLIAQGDCPAVTTEYNPVIQGSTILPLNTSDFTPGLTLWWDDGVYSVQYKDGVFVQSTEYEADLADSVSFSLDFLGATPPAPASTAATTPLSLYAAQIASSTPLSQQLCSAIRSSSGTSSCPAGQIMLASSFLCGFLAASVMDLPLIDGSTSIQTHSRIGLCGVSTFDPPVLQWESPNEVAPELYALCCSAYDLCELTQPLPAFLDTTSLQQSFPDQQSATVTCLAGYAFPGLLRSLVVTCAISTDGPRVITLPDCAVTSCPTLNGGLTTELPGGHGQLSTLTGATGDVALVQCDAGYAIAASSPSSITCTGSVAAGGQGWQPAPPSSSSAWCQPADSGLASLSWSFPDQYSYSLQWSQFVQPASVNSSAAPQWNLTHSLLFPSPGQINAANAAEAGLLISQSVLLPVATLSYLWLVDNFSHIEGAIVQASLFSFIPVTNTANQLQYAYQSETVAPVLELPCGCDVAGNPSGFPLQLQLTQALDSTNALSLSFLPQSLCSPNYQIVQVNMTTGVISNDSIPLLQTYYAENAASCPFLTTAATTVGQVTWQTAGQVANYCVTAVPQLICSGCVPYYIPGSSIPPFGSDTAPDITTCTALPMLFWFTISGAVTTPGQTGPSSPVGDVTVTAVVSDPSGATLLFTEPGSGLEVNVSGSTVSDEYGQYSLTIASPLISGQQYVNVALSGTRSDALRESGLTVLTKLETGTTIASRNATSTGGVSGSLVAYRLVQLASGTAATYSDGSHSSAAVSNRTALTVSLQPVCPPAQATHSLQSKPNTTLAASSPYQLCAILTAAGWSVAIDAVVTTQLAVVSSTAAGAPLIAAGWPIISMHGSRVYTAGSTLVNSSFTLPSNSSALLYVYGSQQNAYTPAFALGDGNDQPSAALHVLDAAGISLKFAHPAPLEPHGALSTNWSLYWDASSGQYTEGTVDHNAPTFSSVTYRPLGAGGVPKPCSASVVVPAAAVYSPAVEAATASQLLAWFPFDTSLASVSSSWVLTGVAVEGESVPALDASQWRFGTGSLQGNGSASYLSKTLRPALSLNTSTLSISLWVLLSAVGPTPQPLVVLQSADTALLLLTAFDDGSSFTVTVLTSREPFSASATRPDSNVQAGVPVWTHVVLTVDSASQPNSQLLALYINGLQIAAVSTQETPGSAWLATALDVAGSALLPSSVAAGLSGYLDELMLMTGPVLTATQVLQLYGYNLQLNVAPAYPLGVPVQVPLTAAAAACNLSTATSLLWQAAITTTTNSTTTTTSAAGVATVGKTVTQSSQSLLSWTAVWSPSTYAAVAAIAAPVLSASAYSGCAQTVNNSSNPVCPPYPAALLQSLLLLGQATATSPTVPVLLDHAGDYLSPVALYAGAVVSSIVVPASSLLSVTPSGGALALSPSLTQSYSNNAVVSSALSLPVTSSVVLLSTAVTAPVNPRNTSSVQPSTALLTVTLSNGLTVSTFLSHVVAYALLADGASNSAFPLIYDLLNATVVAQSPVSTASNVPVELTVNGSVSAAELISGTQTAALQAAALQLGLTVAKASTALPPTTVAVTVVHNITAAGSSAAALLRVVAFGAQVTGSLQDNSAQSVSGRVSFAAATAVPGIELCGVQGVIVSAFALADTGFSYPLSSSAVTGTDGVYSLALDVGEPVNLVASYWGNTSLQSFVPAALQLTPSTQALAGLNFQDATTNTLTLQIVGGMCEAPVGSVVPVLVLDGCGGRHFPLPAFTSTPAAYQLPAVTGTILSYTAEPADGSGLQLSAGQTSSAQLQYQAAVNAFLITNGQLVVNLSVSDQAFTIVYIAPTAITQLQPPPSQLPCVQSGLPFDIASSGSVYSLQWSLSQQYGVPNVSSLSCGQIDTTAISLFVYDGLSDDQSNPCVTLGCSVPLSYDVASSTTTATYSTTLGAPYIFTREPSAPDYTRTLAYGITGTALQQANADYVLVTGSVAYQGISSIAVPPENTTPLYILRRPPGGSSVASFTGSYTLTTARSTSNSTASTVNEAATVGVAIDIQGFICELVGLGVEAGPCAVADRLQATALFAQTHATQYETVLNAASSGATVSTLDFSTTTDPLIVDGDGDAFLLVAATVDESLYTTLTASPANAPLSQYCYITPPYDSPRAVFNAARQLVWFSVFDITQYEIIDAQLLAEQLLAANGGSSSFSDASTGLAYVSALLSVQRWQALLAYNAQLKATALPWPELVQHFVLPTATDPNNLLDLTATVQLASTTAVVAFSGDMGAVGFSAGNVDSTTTGGSSSSTSTNTFGYQGSASLLVFGLGPSATLTASTGGITVNSATYSAMPALSNSLAVSLSDPDRGDEFSVAILRDTVYGSPVYQTLSGRSRCPAEANTVAREVVSMTLAQASFVQVPPGSSASTVLTINMLGPFQETFTYTLSVDNALNPDGLLVTANGQLLGSTPETLVLPYGATAMALSFARPPASSQSTFDVLLELYPVSCPLVLAASVSAQVQFIPQCAAVAFAGDLAYSDSFTVNAAIAGSGQVYSMSIRNPDAYIAGRSWAALNASGVLQSIAVQYKPVSATQAEWQQVPVEDAAFTPISPGGALAGDYYAFQLDVSDLNGDYDFRILAQCETPVLVLDPTLYQTVSAVVTGTVDLLGPSVLAYEPGLQRGDTVPTYYPGDSISVSFSEDIVCGSTQSTLSLSAWYSANASLLQRGATVHNTLSTMPFICLDNAISLDFAQPPPWAQLVGSYVAVQVGGVTDVAGNPLASLTSSTYVTWAFLVANFNYSSAAVTISGLGLAGSSQSIAQQLSSSSTGSGHRRLLLDVHAEAEQLVEGGSAAALWLFNGTDTLARELFERRLEARLRSECVAIIDLYRARVGLRPAQWAEGQLSVLLVTSGPVSISLRLSPSANPAAISPAEAGFALVSALLASANKSLGQELSSSRFPLLSQHAVRPFSQRLDRGSGLRVDIDAPPRDASDDEAAALDASEPSVSPSSTAHAPSGSGISAAVVIAVVLAVVAAQAALLCVVWRVASRKAAASVGRTAAQDADEALDDGMDLPSHVTGRA